MFGYKPVEVTRIDLGNIIDEDEEMKETTPIIVKEPSIETNEKRYDKDTIIEKLSTIRLTSASAIFTESLIEECNTTFSQTLTSDSLTTLMVKVID